jgi:predicted transcriptional regulator
MIQELQAAIHKVYDLPKPQQNEVCRFISQLIAEQQDDLDIAAGLADVEAGHVISSDQMWADWEAQKRELFSLTDEELAGVERSKEDFRLGRTYSIEETQTKINRFLARLRSQATGVQFLEQHQEDLDIAEGIADAAAGRVVPTEQVWAEWDERQKKLFPTHT